MTFRARVAAATLAASLVAAAPAAAAPPVQPGQQGFPHRPVCGPPAARHARCNAEVVTEADGVTPLVTPGPAGYGPADLVSAYKLPAAPPAAGQKIAIVDAYDLPTAEKDLNVYRSQFGLGDCTTANTCFTKVGQGNALPAADASWGQEIALDLDMASAVCPTCQILLVEANSASIADLSAAVDKAAALGATVISNSYGAREFSGETAYDSHYKHPGIAITVSSGDSGYGVQWPAASPWVTAVGGTSLKQAATTARGWTESAWSGAGSGCSAVEAKPSWQPASTGCGRRAVADVAAVADPNTGVAVYDSTPYQGSAGWMVFGGTSVAAPVIAGVYALAGNAASVSYGSYPYSHTNALFDVMSGSNGRCVKRTAQLCRAASGWDGPTGLGTPFGADAF
ncbi:MAG: peptidase S8 [Actinobacteria bacterium]|nr:MAG: peptidase S8 [Actinomycetota bacterium]